LPGRSLAESRAGTGGLHVQVFRPPPAPPYQLVARSCHNRSSATNGFVRSPQRSRRAPPRRHHPAGPARRGRAGAVPARPGRAAAGRGGQCGQRRCRLGGWSTPVAQRSCAGVAGGRPPVQVVWRLPCETATKSALPLAFAALRAVIACERLCDSRLRLDALARPLKRPHIGDAPQFWGRIKGNDKGTRTRARSEDFAPNRRAPAPPVDHRARRAEATPGYVPRTGSGGERRTASRVKGARARTKTAPSAPPP
jgi:hypothetical protein